VEAGSVVPGGDNQQGASWRPYWEEDTLTLTHLPTADGYRIPYGPPPQRPSPEAEALAETPGRGNFINRIFSELRNPLYRGGYVLIANTIATNAIGLVFWLVAARLYGPVALGRASALVSALMLVATLSQLNLSSTLVRFLPQLGSQSAGKLIKLSYLLTTVAALAGGVIFILIAPRLSSEWHFLSASTVMAALFIVAVVSWELFTLQDAALIGLQRPDVIPLENLAFGVMKLALLVAGVEVMRSTDILISWTVPLIALVPLMNWLIFHRYLKRRRGHDTVPGGFRLRQLSRFTSVDYIGLLFSQVTGNFMPLLVISTLGPAASGSYYIAGIITGGAVVLGLNFSTALTVEGSASPNRLAQLTRGVLRRCLLTMIPGTIALILGAHLIAELYGTKDVARTATLLQLMALSLFPCSIAGVAFALDRIAKKPGRAALGQFALAAMTLGGSWLLLGRLGVYGVAIAGVTADVVVAVARIPTVVAALRGKPTIPEGQDGPGGQPRQPRGVDPRPADDRRAEAGWSGGPDRPAQRPGAPRGAGTPPGGPGRLRPSDSPNGSSAGPGRRAGSSGQPDGTSAWAGRPGDPTWRSGVPNGQPERGDRPDDPLGLPGPREGDGWRAVESRTGGLAKRPHGTGSQLNGDGRRPRPSGPTDEQYGGRPWPSESAGEGYGGSWSSVAPGGPPGGRHRARPGGNQGSPSSSPPSRPGRGYVGRHRSGEEDDA